MAVFAVPRDLPEEFEKYEQRVRQLDVGEVGKSGEVSLELEADRETGETVAAEVFCKVPLQVQRVLHPDDAFPEMAYVYLMSPSGGILQGDRLKISVRLRRGAQAHVTTQAATKVYRMSRNYAVQEVDLEVGRGCYLEFVPDQLIPYGGSRFHQSATLRVHDEGTIVYSEVVTPGRTGRGESFRYDVCSLKTEGRDLGSRVRFRDAILVEPKSADPLDAFEPSETVFGSLYVVTRAAGPSSLCDAVDAELRASSVTGGVSALPGKDGVFARMTAASSEELKAAIAATVSRLRRDILGRAFSGTRKY